MSSNHNFAYYNTVDQIYHAEWSIPKLARQALLHESINTLWPNGHPTQLIHVAGTSGKGSTCRFLELGLGTVGRSGAFVGPHLFDYRERFSIRGQFAEPDDITKVWETRIKPHCIQLALRNQDHVHTFYDTSILIALALFDLHEIEWAAVEPGIGGRYDQTRGLDVVATVLTNVGSDHASVLGSQLWQRVMDKAGIARAHVPFFTSETDEENLAVVTSICDAVHAPLRCIAPQHVDAFRRTLDAYVQTQNSDSVLAKNALLSSSFQHQNAALAYGVIENLLPYIDPMLVCAAFCQATLPGRFSQIEENIYIDMAHNAEKITALVHELERQFPAQRFMFVVGMSKGRSPAKVFPPLFKVASTIIITNASFKGFEPEEVRAQLQALQGDVDIHVILDPTEALDSARALCTDDEKIVVTGSTYMIEQMLNPDPYLRHMNATFGWRVGGDVLGSGVVR
ncbi:MAG: hypothetical protein AAF639_00715 [Chloroflexota bacterium]